MSVLVSLSSGLPPVALKETCRVVHGTVPLWPFHRARLAAGGCGEALLSRVDAAACVAATEFSDRETHRARLTVIVREDGSTTAEVTRCVSSLDVPHGPLIARVDVAVRPVLPPGPAKPADRSVYDDCHRRARALGARQGILVDPDDFIIDGTTATVWIAENGVLSTSPSPSAVPGVARAFVLKNVKAAGLVSFVEPLTWERFERADEAFLTNAFGGAVPVRGRGGAIYVRVAKMFSGVWRY